MAVDLDAYRKDPREVERVSSLFKLVPVGGRLALDIGARDGHLARLLADRFDKMVALDLEMPQIDHPRIDCVKGDVTQLGFAEGAFDVVLCAEVLEHIPNSSVAKAAQAIARVTGHTAVIGVPNRQDVRVACTTCRSCGKVDPPYGHVNSFDEKTLAALFKELTVTATDYVGSTRASTNAVSAALLAYTGHPFGTYEQDEPCVYFGATLLPPLPRSPLQRVATRCAHWCDALQRPFVPERGKWLHMRLDRMALAAGASS
jgi:SAM-dependent methyltransferase